MWGRSARGKLPNQFYGFNAASPQYAGLIGASFGVRGYGIQSSVSNTRFIMRWREAFVQATGAVSSIPVINSVIGPTVDYPDGIYHNISPAIDPGIDVGLPNHSWTAWVWMRSYGAVGQAYIRGAMNRWHVGVGPTYLPGSTLRVGSDGTIGNRDKLNFLVSKVDLSGLSATASFAFPLLQWHHIAGTYDNVTVRLYYDGVEVASTAGAGYGYENSGTMDFGADYTGTGDSTANRYWDGYLADMRMYSIALPPQTIYQMYNPATRFDLYRQSGLTFAQTLNSVATGKPWLYYAQQRVA